MANKIEKNFSGLEEVQEAIVNILGIYLNEEISEDGKEYLACGGGLVGCQDDLVEQEVFSCNAVGPEEENLYGFFFYDRHSAEEPEEYFGWEFTFSNEEELRSGWDELIAERSAFYEALG